MGEKKVTVMILKVDLHCEGCYKKVKKVLCKFPEIRDRVFDEKSNTVMIKVFCCDPEKIRSKLCGKGGGTIKSIEIKQLEQPKPVENPKPDPPKPKEATPPPAVKSPESIPTSPDPAPKATDQAQNKPAPAQEQPKSPPKSPEPAPKSPDSSPKPIYSYPRTAEPMPLFGSVPIPTCCEQCYGGRTGGPCNYWFGPQQPGYYEESYNGRTGYYAYGPPGGPNRLCHPGRCAEYFSEENPVGCSVM